MEILVYFIVRKEVAIHFKRSSGLVYGKDICVCSVKLNHKIDDKEIPLKISGSDNHYYFRKVKEIKLYFAAVYGETFKNF